MEIPKEIVELAVKGGWHKDADIRKWVIEDDSVSGYAVQKVNGNEGILCEPGCCGVFATYAEIVLDPEFWRYLGKELGWKSVGTGPHSTDHHDEYIYQAEDFYHLILTGGDTSVFWQSLLDSRK